MSDTPLTDAATYECRHRLDQGGHATASKHSDKDGDCVSADFASDLGCKLQIARAALERILHPHHSRDAVTPPSWAIAAEALEATKP